MTRSTLPGRPRDAGRHMTALEYARARRVLVRRDPVLAGIIARHGVCPLAERAGSDIFSGLVEAIVSQQLSTRAAATIHERLKARLAPATSPTPAGIMALDDEVLRSVGLSRQKMRYLRDLSQKVLEGTLATDGLADKADEEVIEAVTRVTGIGRWSADMLLIFRLLRPDVLPVGDLGIIKAVQRAYGLRKPPNPDRLTQIGEPWRPYRSVASWYLWASLDNAPRPRAQGA